MSEVKELPTQEYLQECFDYDESTGELTWKERPLYHFKNKTAMESFNAKRKDNKKAFRIDFEKKSYCTSTICGITTSTHRIIWKLVTGKEPKGQIDHINRNESDNRFSNLRDVTVSENQHNRAIPRDNKSGYKGVSYNSTSNKWLSCFNIRGNAVSLGQFKNKEDAINARKEAELKDWSHLETKKKIKSNFILTSDNISECFSYYPETGDFFWKERPRSHFANDNVFKSWNIANAGNKINTIKRDGYIYVFIANKTYVVQRLIYWLHTGIEVPKHMRIDHINNVRHDNRWCNLRMLTPSQNSMNSKNNTDKLKGCSFDKSRNKWRAKIICNGITTYLGQFETELEAHSAYCKASTELHGEYANHG